MQRGRKAVQDFLIPFRTEAHMGGSVCVRRSVRVCVCPFARPALSWPRGCLAVACFVLSGVSLSSARLFALSGRLPGTCTRQLNVHQEHHTGDRRSRNIIDGLGLDHIKQAWDAPSLGQNSPDDDPPANGAAEKTVQDYMGQVRAMMKMSWKRG